MACKPILVFSISLSQAEQFYIVFFCLSTTEKLKITGWSTVSLFQTSGAFTAEEENCTVPFPSTLSSYLGISLYQAEQLCCSVIDREGAPEQMEGVQGGVPVVQAGGGQGGGLCCQVQDLRQ